MAGRNDAQNVFQDSLVDFICQNFSQIYPVCSKSVHRLFLLEVNYSNTFLSTFHSRAATTGVMTPFCTTWPPAWLTWRVFAGTATLPGFEPTTVARCLISWCRQIWDLTFAFWTREKTGLDFITLIVLTTIKCDILMLFLNLTRTLIKTLICHNQQICKLHKKPITFPPSRNTSVPNLIQIHPAVWISIENIHAYTYFPLFSRLHYTYLNQSWW